MRIVTIVLTIMMMLSPLSAEMFSSFSYDRGASQEVSVGTVELKGRGAVNLVTVLEFVKTQKDSKIYKTDEYSKFLEHIKTGAKSVVLKVLLEKPSIEPIDLKVIRDNIQTAVSKYIALEAKKSFPLEAIDVDFAVIMLYVSDPFDHKD